MMKQSRRPIQTPIEFDSALYRSNQTDEMADDSEGSCFDEVVNSHWIAALGGKVTVVHHHYQVGTYDDVIDVVCERYELRMYQRI